jgi:hypothetical protein
MVTAVCLRSSVDCYIDMLAQGTELPTYSEDYINMLGLGRGGIMLCMSVYVAFMRFLQSQKKGLTANKNILIQNIQAEFPNFYEELIGRENRQELYRAI